MRSAIRIVALVLCLTFVLSMWAFVSAFTVKALPITLHEQEKDWWCWAACSLACIKYYFPNSTLTQNLLVMYVKGAVVDEGGNSDEIISALEHGAVTGSLAPGDVFIAAIQTEVDNDRPSIIITENNYSGDGHVVLAHGYELGNNSRYIAYKDPKNENVTCVFDVGSMSGSGNSFTIENDNFTENLSRGLIKDIEKIG